MRQQRKRPANRLRKQPRLKRVDLVGSAALPGVMVPSTAKKRRKRNTKKIPFPTTGFLKVATSPRWLSLGLVSVCLMALLLIGRDGSFYLMALPVEGANTLSENEIIRTSGLEGEHVFAADPNEAATKIGQIPGVISATVVLHWPNQVNIAVKEDMPIATWIQAGERFWVYGDGRLLNAGLSDGGLLRIRSEVDEPVGENKSVPLDVVIGGLQLQKLRDNIEELIYRPGPGLSYQDGRGWRVYFGSGANMDQKLAVYDSIIDHLKASNIAPAYVSVSNQMKPYYMPIGEA